MSSGYEKSPDYGGKPFTKRGLFGAACLFILITGVLGWVWLAP